MTLEEKRAYHRAYYHRWKVKNRDKLREYQARSRANNRVKRNAYTRKWKKENREHCNRYARRYRQIHLDRIKEQEVLAHKKDKAKHPGRWRARSAINHAVRSGRVIKPGACQGCREPGKLQAHHPDYRKPLQVWWLCVPCHKKADRGELCL